MKILERITNILLALTAIAALVALGFGVKKGWGAENPLDGYTAYGVGICALNGPDGTKVVSPCVALGKEGDENANYFGLLDDDGEVWLILRQDKATGEVKSIWKKPAPKPAKTSKQDGCYGLCG